MRDGEKGAVRSLARRAFSALEGVFFSPPPQTLVAERDGQVVGAVVPKILTLPGKREYGGMFWLMTDPQVHGLGVGGWLVEAALRYFEEHGCQETFACVEGFNTSSSNLFAARGFSILSLGEQFRRYGPLGTLSLWIKMFRMGNELGNFLWARPGARKPDNPVLQWWGGVLVSTFLFLLAGWRGRWMEGFEPMALLSIALAVTFLYGLREAAMKLAARLQGLSVRHRVWEAAFPLSFAVALVVGLFFPMPGSVYPRAGAWRYRDLVSKLGPTAFAGASAVLLFTWAAWSLLRFGGPPPEIASWLRFGHAAGQMLTLFEAPLPFSIFTSFSGRRVWDWSRPAWAVLAIATLGLFLARG